MNFQTANATFDDVPLGLNSCGMSMSMFCTLDFQLPTIYLLYETTSFYVYFLCTFTHFLPPNIVKEGNIMTNAYKICSSRYTKNTTLFDVQFYGIGKFYIKNPAVYLNYAIAGRSMSTKIIIPKF